MMAQGGTEMYCKICTVDSVNEDARTIDCSPIDESAPLVGVNLQADQSQEVGVVAIPVEGSSVVVAADDRSRESDRYGWRHRNRRRGQ